MTLPMTETPTPAPPPLAYSLDPESFLSWLATLPQESPLPGWQEGDEPFLPWLRAQGVEDAALVADLDGDYQQFCAAEALEEVPGVWFWFYDVWEPEWPVGRGAAVFRSWLTAWEADEEWTCPAE